MSNPDDVAIEEATQRIHRAADELNSALIAGADLGISATLDIERRIGEPCHLLVLIGVTLRLDRHGRPAVRRKETTG